MNWPGCLQATSDHLRVVFVVTIVVVLCFSPCRRCSELDGPALLEGACACGYNPHCHFILLLESISFDHSFLLDLLISSETCFLEYFVQYLRCLLADWQGFAVACGRTLTSASRLRSAPASLRARQTSASRKGRIQPGEVPACIPAHLPGLDSPPEATGSAPGLQLVDYSSSDESDRETAGPQGATRTNRICAPDVQQEPARRRDVKAPRSAGPERTSDVGCELSTRALGCLSELKEVVGRLHARKLFPYNPAPLLKLLGQVQDSAEMNVTAQPCCSPPLSPSK